MSSIPDYFFDIGIEELLRLMEEPTNVDLLMEQIESESSVPKLPANFSTDQVEAHISKSGDRGLYNTNILFVNQVALGLVGPCIIA